ncbi:MAG: flagella basal body P-ring formation protein FlgA [Nitrospirae bacterium]|nr:MAG: flagella basal body P-ring formation protein FlgA [Nitrospirota bacterium]
MVPLVLVAMLTLMPVKLEGLLAEYLTETYHWEDVQVRLVSVEGEVPSQNPEDIKVLKGPLGRAVFVLSYGDGTEVKVTSIVRAKVRVLVASKPIRKGQVLRPSMVAERLMDIQRVSSDMVTDLESIKAMRARYHIRAGTLLRMGMFEKEPEFKKGQKVTVLYQRGALRVTSAGVLREDAREGMVVEVMNLATKKVIKGLFRKGGIVDVTP